MTDRTRAFVLLTVYAITLCSMVGALVCMFLLPQNRRPDSDPELPRNKLNPLNIAFYPSQLTEKGRRLHRTMIGCVCVFLVTYSVAWRLPPPARIAPTSSAPAR